MFKTLTNWLEEFFRAANPHPKCVEKGCCLHWNKYFKGVDPLADCLFPTKMVEEVCCRCGGIQTSSWEDYLKREEEK